MNPTPPRPLLAASADKTTNERRQCGRARGLGVFSGNRARRVPKLSYWQTDSDLTAIREPEDPVGGDLIPSYHKNLASMKKGPVPSGSPRPPTRILPIESKAIPSLISPKGASAS